MSLKNLARSSNTIRKFLIIAGIIVGFMLIISLVSATGAAGTNGTSVAGKYWNDAPSIIANISTVSGSTAGGTIVTIHGKRLGRKSIVMFDSVPATNITWISPTTLIVTAPPHAAGTINITITTPRGLSTPSSVGQYTYQTILGSDAVETTPTGNSSEVLASNIRVNSHFKNALPTITSISAINGSTAGGTVITIHGVRLGRNSKVMFGSIPATNITWVSATTLLVTVPSHAAGDGNITIITPHGASETSPASRFTYI